jgi:hypothetical protein
MQIASATQPCIDLNRVVRARAFVRRHLLGVFKHLTDR